MWTTILCSWTISEMGRMLLLLKQLRMMGNWVGPWTPMLAEKLELWAKRTLRIMLPTCKPKIHGLLKLR
eukprot:symbB.v1.2.038484.t1/scaffold6010.1/size21798/2